LPDFYFIRGANHSPLTFHVAAKGVAPIRGGGVAHEYVTRRLAIGLKKR
jgi:hypothetical protein